MDYTLTPEVTTVIKDTGGNGAELLVQGVQFAAALVLVGVLIALVIVLVKIKFTDSSSALSEGKKSIVTIATVFFSFIMFFSLILYINPNLLAFDWFRFSGESGGKTSAPLQTQQTKTNESTGTYCNDPSILISELTRGKPSCFNNAGCSQLCTFDPLVRKSVVGISQNKGVDYHIILALACRESSGNPQKIGILATNGKEDCGFLQIHSGDFGKSKCSEVFINGKNILDLETNVTVGIDTYKKKLDSVSKFSYQGITKESMAFAAYNCCSNGDNPNSRSNDCNTSTGFPYDLPKWACPINPGTSSFNMCKVKNYACDVETCSKRY